MLDTGGSILDTRWDGRPGTGTLRTGPFDTSTKLSAGFAQGRMLSVRAKEFCFLCRIREVKLSSKDCRPGGDGSAEAVKPKGIRWRAMFSASI